MNKPLSSIALGVVAVVVLTAATPAIVQIVHAAVPLVLVVGVVAAVLRAVWFYTR